MNENNDTPTKPVPIKPETWVMCEVCHTYFSSEDNGQVTANSILCKSCIIKCKSGG